MNTVPACLSPVTVVKDKLADEFVNKQGSPPEGRGRRHCWHCASSCVMLQGDDACDDNCGVSFALIFSQIVLFYSLQQLSINLQQCARHAVRWQQSHCFCHCGYALPPNLSSNRSCSLSYCSQVIQVFSNMRKDERLKWYM